MSTELRLNVYIHNMTGIIAIRVINVHSEHCNLSFKAVLGRHLTPGVSTPETGDGVVSQTALRS